MKPHVLRDHSGTPRKILLFPEPSCISTFLSRPGLQKHLLLAHQGFVCKLSGCRLQFADKDALDNHNRTHTRLECAHVGYERSYTDRDGLQKHIRKKQGGVSGSDVTKIIPPAPEPIPGSPDTEGDPRQKIPALVHMESLIFPAGTSVVGELVVPLAWLDTFDPLSR
ncbi:MAG: hypothetical protein J3R72DRAFT_494991 [Linnemannia gamsii]|nr:MAG: hypothetical protein J3R72DRAFT_494991 [Linnemannia gamsii]